MSDPLLLVSALFLVISLVGCFLWGGPKNIFLRILLGIGFWIVFLFTILYFVAHSFTGEGFTEGVTYHLRYGFEDVNFALFKYRIIFGVGLIIGTLCLSLWIALRKKHSKQFFFLAPLFLLLSIGFHPTTEYLRNLISTQVSQTPIDPNSTFYQYYKYPEIEQTGKPLNLVVLYLESVERAHLDDEIFPGLTPNLKKLESQSISFTNLYQAPHTGFTIGALVASQCGIPSIAPSRVEHRGGTETYLGGAKCLGDLLSEAGYDLTYYGGASSRYSGKGLFYRSHGFDEVQGFHGLKPRIENPKYRNGWGLYDDSLLGLVYDRFIELSEKQKPFGIFSLTIDTHPPGYLSQTCEQNGVQYKRKNKILSAIHCSDWLVADFVQKIRQSPYGENTVIAIMTDHLSYAFASKLNQKQRGPLLFINMPQGESQTIKTVGTHYDFSSTLLPLIGFSAEIGLGQNLFTADLAEAAERKKIIKENTSKWTQEIMSFWNFPKLGEELFIDSEANKVFVGGQSLKLPLMLKFQEDFTIHPVFAIDPFQRNLNLLNKKQHTNNKPFIIIESCYNTNLMVQSNHTQKPKGLCMLSPYKHISLKGIESLSRAEIEAMLGIGSADDDRTLILVDSGFSTRVLRLSKQELQKTDVVSYLKKAVGRRYEYFSIPLKINKKQLKCLLPQCEVEDIFTWMRLPINQDNHLVVDDIKVLRHIAKNTPEIVPQIIAQIDDPKYYQELKENLRFGKVIWHVDSFILKLQENNIPMSKGFAVLNLMKGSVAAAISPLHLNPEVKKFFKKKRIPLYVFRIKDTKEKSKLQEELGVDRFYFDQLDL